MPVLSHVSGSPQQAVVAHHMRSGRTCPVVEYYYEYHGSTVGLPWVYYESTMSLLWVYYGSTMSLLWVYYESTMGLL